MILGDSMVKVIKSWKMSSRTCEVELTRFNGAITKDMKSYVIPTVEEKLDNIILQTGKNDLKTIDTPEQITMGILNLATTCKADTTSVLYLVLSQDITSLMRKLQK